MKKKKTALRILFMLIVIVLITACTYEIDFDPISGKWYLKFWSLEYPDKKLYNTITFNTDGTFTVEENMPIFGGTNGTQTWSQDNANLNLNATGSDCTYTYTSNWTGVLSDSDTSTPSRAEGTFNFSAVNGTTNPMPGEWELSPEPFNNN